LKSLFFNLKYIFSEISKTGRIFLFLDYDGTLCPIVKRPDRAILPLKTRHILSRLADNKRIVVSIISGRMLRQVKNLVGLKGIHYAGCHGFEIEKADKAYFFPKLSKLKIRINAVRRRLKIELSAITGWEIEEKDIIFALHYRRVKNNNIQKLKNIFYNIVKPYKAKEDIVIAKGKMVLEVRPGLNWDKGRYCLYLMNKLKYKGEKILPLYIGDDTTDETAFKVLRRKGITVFVKGERKISLAEYYLGSTNEVTDFLGRLNRQV
jgi:trehalose-phosphatase